jgi:hypothetical protein
LYAIDGRTVRKVLPDDTARLRKTNRSYKNLFEQFDEIDARNGR